MTMLVREFTCKQHFSCLFSKFNVENIDKVAKNWGYHSVAWLRANCIFYYLRVPELCSQLDNMKCNSVIPWDLHVIWASSDGMNIM